MKMEWKKGSGTAEGWQDRKWAGLTCGNFERGNTCDREVMKKGAA